jgi:hypothetical protein
VKLRQGGALAASCSSILIRRGSRLLRILKFVCGFSLEGWLDS